ncbi:hypothetical protein GCM10010207_85490 [Streptomyces atratus]|nr:hypothetical protein GCM10010207_85490 [Streptomyces atratus]
MAASTVPSARVASANEVGTTVGSGADEAGCESTAITAASGRNVFHHPHNITYVILWMTYYYRIELKRMGTKCPNSPGGDR